MPASVSPASSLPNTGTSRGVAGTPSRITGPATLYSTGSKGSQGPRPPLLAGSPLLRTFLQTQLSAGMAREGLPRTGAGERSGGQRPELPHWSNLPHCLLIPFAQVSVEVSQELTDRGESTEPRLELENSQGGESGLKLHPFHLSPAHHL